jgi:hypothetical protein
LLIGRHCQNNGHVAMSDAEYDIAKDLGGTPRSSLSLQRTRLARCKPWQEHQPLGSRIHLQIGVVFNTCCATTKCRVPLSIQS